MIAPLSIVLVVLLHVIGFVRGGPYEVFSFFVVWTMGMFGVSTFIIRVGKPRPGDQLPTVTGDNDTDFALAAIWPIGFWIVFGYFITKKINQ